MVTLAGLTFTLNSYVSTDDLTTEMANKVSTDTELYIKKIDLFTNSIRLGWKESGDQTVMVPNLMTFQALMARVEALEMQVQTLSTQTSTAEQARTNIESTQDSIWAFTQLALQRLTDGGL